MVHYPSVADTVQALISRQNPYNHHLPRTGVLAERMADVMGMSTRQREFFVWGTRLHDVGKLCVDLDTLNLPRRLSDNEYELIKQHAPLGAAVARALDWDAVIVDVVEHHHENFDGSGYPDGLQGAAISLEARCVRLIDMWDALRNVRAYREALGVEEARGVMLQHRDWFDPDLLTLFLNEVAVHE